MENEKFFIKGDGKLVVFYEDESGKHLAVCEPVEDVVMLSVGVKAGAKKKGQRSCKNCGQPGHTRKTCPK